MSADRLEAARQALPFGAAVTAVAATPVAERVERLTLRLRDGAERLCILKRTGPWELKLYQSVLTPAETGAPALLGAVRKAGPQGCWLFLEPLNEAFVDFAQPDQVALAYRHLAALHRRFAGAPLPAVDNGDSPWEISRTEIQAILRTFPRTAPHATEAAQQLTQGPRTLVQGDFHRWNLLLQHGAIRVVDWEHAAPAHPVWDLVMLAPEEPALEVAPRGALAETALRTYHEQGLLAGLPWPDFLRLQLMARLFVAARWALRHRQRAERAAPGEAADLIATYASAETARVEALADRLSWPRV